MRRRAAGLAWRSRPGETLVSLRPFASRHALLQAARKAMANWGEDELNAALSVHPRIGEKPTGGACGAVAPSSRRWTARMSGSRRPCGRECRYEARFGRVF